MSNQYFDISTFDLSKACKALEIPVTGPYVQPSIVWVDIETTGLNVKKDRMLEFGMILTNAYGEVIEGGVFQAYIDQNLETPSDIQYVKESCEEFVQKLHDNSELWDDLEEAHERGETYTPFELSDAILGWFEDRDLQPETYEMAGSSVDFDRKFVSRDMPEVANSEGPGGWFHYRVLDVSTLKVVASKVNPEVVQTKPNKGEHRVVQDLLYTIAEYRHYLDELIYTERDAEAIHGGNED